MKLQIAFDLSDLDKALIIAKEVEEFVDIFEIGSLLIYKNGDAAIRRFKETFPQKTLLADAKIADRSKEAISICTEAGADWVTVMAGTGRNVVHTACTAAHEQGKRIMLDLMDASSLGQSALDAKSLGVDALLFHKPSDEDTQMMFLDMWDMLKGNTPLPIFVSGPITRETIKDVLHLQPYGIVVGKAITDAANPREEAEYFYKLVHE
jgi:3-hexulose-6-phosphate synthase